MDLHATSYRPKKQGTTSLVTELVEVLYRNKWVVFSKAPQWWQSPEQLIKYLSHYVNRVAISNDRILNVTDESVLFSYKDYRDGKTKKMPLSTNEFIRRFLMHILPKGFRKVRYYGILSNRKKKTSLLHVACFVSTSVSGIMQKKKIFRKLGKRWSNFAMDTTPHSVQNAERDS